MSATQGSFGFEKATPEARDAGVQRVFSSVAARYDVMNDLMSGGLHRLWKTQMVAAVPLSPDMTVMDLAGGTGDIAFRIYDKIQATNHKPQITVCDRNPEMLAEGRKRAMNRGILDLVWQEGDAQALPFADKSFDVVTIAFGLRNVTHLSQALGEIRRVLKTGGKFLCLEFSPELSPKMLQPIYDFYSFQVIPKVGELVAQDRDSYQYLAESIRVFPKPEALCALMREAGFAEVRHSSFTFGTVALHTGYRI